MKMLKSWTAVAGMVLLSVALANAEDAKGNLRYSISVSKFENRAGWRGQWDLGDAWGAVLTDALTQSGKFIVLGEADMRGAAMAEQDLATAGRTAGGGRAPATGQMTPAQLLVKGEITHVQSSTTGGSGGVRLRGVRIGGSADTAEINATLYVVDSRTGQVKASTRVVGKAGRRGLGVGYSGAALGGLTGDLAGFKNDNVGKATEDAVGQAVEFLMAQLDTIPWEGSVALVRDARIAVNRGSREGVALGQQFVVGMVEEIVDEDTGEILDRSVVRVGVLQVTEVREKISYCTALEGGDKIERGMSIQPL